MRKIIFATILFYYSNSFAWDNTVTHMDLSGAAATISAIDHMLLDKEYTYNGETKTLLFWLEEGAKLEDAGSNFALGTARFRNHFHNPLASLSAAGLSDLMSGESTVLWAQDGTNQANFVEGDWSWQMVRNHYYRSLTATNKAEIDEFTVKTYKGLGYQMHLLQDMSQPDHVRNDAHPVDGSGIKGFEKWAKNRRTLISQYAASATKPTVDLKQPLEALVPVGRFMDTRRYFSDRTPSSDSNQGLAEYTNSNFFSDDSIFAARFATDDKHYFPFPRKEGTDIQTFFSGTKQPETVQSEDGKSVKGLWISKIAEGVAISHLARVGPLADFYYSVFGEGTLFYDSLYRDEITLEDYARLLIPRAVGYSASLLDYFFRGKIDISVPANGLYSMIPGTATGFTSIKLLAKNSSAAGEEMTDGSIELVMKYKVAQEDPFKSGPVPTTPDFSYIVAPEKNNVRTFSRSYTEFNFDLNLPLYATDIYLQLVYKGRLGNEDGAVAVGFKDISEPTPIDMFNSMDKICINGSWYEAGSPLAIEQVDTNPHDGIAGLNEADVYSHGLANLFFRFTPYATSPPSYASPTAYDFTVPSISPGNHLRVVFILSDYLFTKSSYLSIVKFDPPDPFTHMDKLGLWGQIAVKRQREYTEDNLLCKGNPPCYTDVYPEHRVSYSTDFYSGFYTFRNATMWWGSVRIYFGPPYPTNSQCSYDLL